MIQTRRGRDHRDREMHHRLTVISRRRYGKWTSWLVMELPRSLLEKSRWILAGFGSCDQLCVMISSSPSSRGSRPPPRKRHHNRSTHIRLPHPRPRVRHSRPRFLRTVAGRLCSRERQQRRNRCRKGSIGRS